MRAPPLAVKQTSGHWRLIAWFTASTNRAPTVYPMDPPIKENSKAQATSGIPFSLPDITIKASVSPYVLAVLLCAALIEEGHEPFAGWHPHVTVAFWADKRCFTECWAIEFCAALFALRP
eukprot:gene647-biopygen9194